MVNAGLAEDAATLEATGADGIGLFRTEFQFLIAATLPGRESQLRLYKSVLDAAGDKPVVFRTVDIGGDKALPYLAEDEKDESENPAMGWRALRLSLERKALMKAQARALIEASAGKTLRVMFPMVCEPWEYEEARALFEEQIAWAKSAKRAGPEAGRIRRDAGSAEPGRDARHAAAAGRFPVDRHQRPDPIPVRRRPRRPAAGRALRLAEPGDPALPAPRRRCRPRQPTCRCACAARWPAGRWRRWR